MAAPNTAPPANPTSAVQVWTPSAVAAKIAEYPEDRFIALFPRTVMSQVNPMLSPVIETVVLNPDPENGDDVYTSRDLKQNHVALTKVALRRVMSLAGASMIDSRRMDDGSDPLYVLWQVVVERQVPGRPKPERAIGTKEIRLGPDQTKGWSPERIVKAREHMIRMAEAKACNAALRDLLTLKQQYHVNEVRKPFVVLRWEPNMSHPAVAERFLDNLLPATTAAYGPPTDAPQLTQGDAPFELAPSQPDDDDTVHEGQFVEVKTNGHATVDRGTGDIVAERAAPDFGLSDDAGGPLDWGDATSVTPTQAAAAAPNGPSLTERLQLVAEENVGSSGPMTEAAKQKLSALLEPVGKLFPQGLERAFGIQPAGMQQRHAIAILTLAQQLGDDEFRGEWRAMVRGTGGD